MLNVNHHPSAELLSAYAAASLPLSQALCVAAHLEHCEECRQNLSKLESLGGKLFEQLAPASPSDALRHKVLNKIDTMSSAEKTETPHGILPPAKTGQQRSSHTEISEGIPRCLRQFIRHGFDDLDWKHISPSIRRSELVRDSNGAKVELLRIKPGGSVATHTHLGNEFTVVLKGGFSDEQGYYHAGDLVIKSEEQIHTPVATLEEECICLIVSEAPQQFTGFFARWLNPLLRRSFT